MHTLTTSVTTSPANQVCALRCACTATTQPSQANCMHSRYAPVSTTNQQKPAAAPAFTGSCNPQPRAFVWPTSPTAVNAPPDTLAYNMLCATKEHAAATPAQRCVALMGKETNQKQPPVSPYWRHTNRTTQTPVPTKPCCRHEETCCC